MSSAGGRREAMRINKLGTRTVGEYSYYNQNDFACVFRLILELHVPTPRGGGPLRGPNVLADPS